MILVASQLVVGGASAVGGTGGSDKRALCVSQWVRVTAAPALAPHVVGHTQHLLDTLENLGESIIIVLPY